MNDRRSIQDIIPPARSKPIRQGPPDDPAPPDRNTFAFEPEQRSYWPFVLIAAGALIVAASIIGLMSTVFHTGEARVVVAEWRADISGSYSAGGDTSLGYQPLTVEERASKSVPATGTREASDRATGMIQITNTGKQQRLITNTRFETPDGLVYRIHAPVVVPGATTAGGTKTPGTISFQVYADQPGEKYNISSATFTLPGLKGSPQFSEITAATKGALSGGFVGTRAVVEESVRAAAISELRASLDRVLREQITAATPQGSVVFPDSVAITHREEPDRADGGTATITLVGTAVAPAFDEGRLAEVLAERAQVSSGMPLMLKNADALAYAAGPGGSVESGSPISFTLSGSAHLSARFDPAALAMDLAGKSQVEADAVRGTYPALVGPISFAVYPFWVSSLPEDPERITVTVRGALDQNP